MRKLKPLGSRFLQDAIFRTRVTLYFGLCVNLLFFVLDLYTALRAGSVWYGALSIYYLLLAVLHLTLVVGDRRHPIGTDIRTELRLYRGCGAVLLPMNFILAVVVFLSTARGNIFVYPGVLIYAKAVYAFYAIIIGIRNIFTYRRHGSPLLSAAKAVALASALVSMLSLEIALTARFGNSADSFQQIMTSALGGIVCIAILCMAGYMLVRSTVTLRHRKI